MTRREAFAIVQREGGDILTSDGMALTKKFTQHGSTSVFAHCVSVACTSLMLAAKWHVQVNQRAMVRGALLHDYFLYDWHEPHGHLHGLTHARTAWLNARRDFVLSDMEQDIILRHMFPLNVTPPKYRESLIVSMADKLCAMRESK